MPPIRHYQSLVFDCDGVLLDSNRVKTEGFYHAALPYGEEAARTLCAYHIATAGVSRYKKFAYFLEHIVAGKQGPDYETLLKRYAAHVQQSLHQALLAEGLEELRAQTRHANWLVVSGSDQQELRTLFTMRGLAGWFNGGIFGSPDTKEAILARERENGNLRSPALFLGDARYDHEAASRAGLDFIFVHGWSEFTEWRHYTALHRIPVIDHIRALLTGNPSSGGAMPTD